MLLYLANNVFGLYSFRILIQESIGLSYFASKSWDIACFYSGKGEEADFVSLVQLYLVKSHDFFILGEGFCRVSFDTISRWFKTLVQFTLGESQDHKAKIPHGYHIVYQWFLFNLNQTMNTGYFFCFMITFVRNDSSES
jgi:hypothetical protein